MSSTRDIPGPAGQIHIDDGGSGGVPVVFLHSYAGSSSHWKAQLEHLRRTRRAIAIDLRGHGQSAPPAGGDYSVAAFEADLAAVVDSLHLDRFVLVGHSLGGSVSIAYAGAHPEKVAGLVLAGTPGKSPKEQADQVLAAMEADYEKVSRGYWDKLLAQGRPEVQSQIRSETGSVPREASLAIIRAVFEYNPESDLKAYKGPKLNITTGQDDSPGALHKLVPDLRKKEISGTSHWMQMDKPDVFNAILDEFLAGIR
jgi:pimeloyl-ACP methyl ester carboxylesterase